MGRALYRKYRSRSLSEVVGQDHITTTLRNALASGKIAHAYLLTGPRGVGKTSVARILAHEINGLEYSEDPHFDIIEIDAASNNSVEDVRDLRDKIMSAPASAKYKIFIIDEVHMLSKAAFNALLKTLEEPPEHVIFILATTEAHKLPETIISRTQRFSFRPISIEKVVTHLASIAKKEHIVIDKDALTLIAEHGEGSFRDSISLLDQASSLSDHVTQEQVEQLVGHVPSASITRLLSAVQAHASDKVLTELHSMLNEGYEAAMIAIQLGHQIRQMLSQAALSSANLALLKDLLDVPPAYNPPVLLEIILLNHSLPVAETAQKVGSIEKTAVAPVEPTPPSVTVTKAKTLTAPAKDSVTVTTTAPPVEDTISSQPEALPNATSEQAPSLSPSDITEIWQEVLQRLKRTHNTLYGIARMADPTLDNDNLTLALKFPFHQKKLNEPKNRTIIANLLEEVRGVRTAVQCVIDATQPTADKPSSIESVATIRNIFGDAELLES